MRMVNFRSCVSSRNSSLELVRLLAMFMIVFYHLILFFIEPVDPSPIYKAVQIPVHIGVILFVLISGYFGIKPTFHGFFKIICIVAVYYLPLRLWYVNQMGMGGMAMLDSFHILSKTPYWFVRTYLCLYLISPMLNKCLKDISFRERMYYIFAFAIIAVYLGMMQSDITLIDGKNIANFILIYIIGNTIRIEQNRIVGFSNWRFWGGFFILNVVLMFLYVLFYNTKVSDLIWDWSFPYYSPFILVNSIIFFIPFTRYKINSPAINYVAASVFSIYIIHHQPVLLEKCLKPLAYYLYEMAARSEVMCIIMMGMFAFFVMLMSVLIDKILTPLWEVLAKIGTYLEKEIMKVGASYFESESV